jgi:hypothetical protein
MNLDTIIVNNITVGQLLPWIGGAVLVWIFAKLYRALFAKKKVTLQHTVYFVCSQCGWEGHISKFGTRCPKCDTPTGDLQ